MSKLVIDTRSRFERSERLRVAVLTCVNVLLAMAFFALLLADQARAAGG